jgi:hypothetical protein
MTIGSEMARRFLAHQLAEVETELAACAKFADRLGLEIGEHSDEIHWDGAAAQPAEGWMKEVRALQWRLDRAEGLLRAYNIFLTANGENNDHTSAR